MDISLNIRQLNDLELLLNGAFYPLTTYMNKCDYESCIYNMRLSNGDLFPIPIVFSINNEILAKIKIADILKLKDETGILIAELTVGEIYEPKLEDKCKYVLGSLDSTHPYHNIIMKNINCKYISGELKKIQLPLHYDFNELRMGPEETKKYFKKNNWNVVVGFQTRNPLHRSHYELTLNALNQVSKETGFNAKLLLHPVVGITQDCDIDYYTRVRCYKKLVDKYPEDTVLLSLLPLNMRMAGPREALLHAIIRKNYGCTHFIVGRDHAGPSYKTKEGGNFYGTYDAHNLLLEFEKEIGIKIVLSKNIVFIKELQEFSEEDKVPKDMEILNISGTQQREMLTDGVEIPNWFSWPDIIEELRKEFKLLNKKGLCVYLVGLSGSGKSTIANVLINKLKEIETERKITLLDADIIRLNLSKGLGFSKEDRSTNVRRIGYVASEIVKHGGIAVCANIAPYEEDRLFNRRQISQYGKYIEVFVNTSLACCEIRDTKGLYKMARDGKLLNFTGINDPFETPLSFDLLLDGNENNSSIDDNLKKILEKIYN
jgi:sulfate adenylyltransferase